VDPRTELMIAAPEREQSGAKKDADARLAPGYYLRSAEYMLRYHPIEYASQLSCALLLTAVENDAVTPEDHAVDLFEAASGPKKLVRQVGTSHYASYVDNFSRLLEHIVDWYGRYLGPEQGPLAEEVVVLK
jgi:dipeptidyl aminopeptidase/acylaminoacyl peptidase